MSVMRQQTKKLIFGLILVSGVISWLVFSNKANKIASYVENLKPASCDNRQAEEVLKQICTLYKEKEIVGDLCDPLCNTGLLQFVHCLNYRHGKHVIEVMCNEVCTLHSSVPAVLKMTQLNSSELVTQLKDKGRDLLVRLQIPENDLNMSIHEYTITAESLSILIANLLKSEYGFSARDEQDGLSLLWGEDYAQYFQGSKTNLLSARSMWSVATQNEYRISRIFNGWEVFPKIYGSCGPLYLAQYAPGIKSLEMLFPFLSSNFPPWRTRAKLALEILHLVEHMDNMEYPLHLCDIKSPHFGYTLDQKVKFIDADTVFTDETLVREFNAASCKDHKDCSFFDCEGWCQKDKGHCIPVRTNNNLQTVCAKIFQGSLSTFNGLLSSPPKNVAAKISSLVSHCADDITTQHNGISIKTPSYEIMEALQRNLLESINADAIE